MVIVEKKEHDPYAFGLLENYYMANGCFLEEGRLFRDAGKIAHIPAVIVNGRYEVICPPVTAYRLHKLLPKSKPVIAESAGHWMGEKPVEKVLLEAMKEFEYKQRAREATSSPAREGRLCPSPRSCAPCISRPPS